MTLSGEVLIGYVMVLTRVSGMWLVAPGFSTSTLPNRVSVFAVLIISATLSMALPREHVPRELGEVLAQLAIEGIVGLAIGFVFRMTMAGVAAAGEFIGLQMGLGVASTLDPLAGNNALFTQSMMSMLYLVVFMALDGHHYVLRTLHASYTEVPLGQGSWNGGTVQSVLEVTFSVLVLGVRLAAGIFIPLKLVSFSLALVSRAFPQANVFILSYTISMILGLWLLAAEVPALREEIQAGIGRDVLAAMRWIRELAMPMAP